ncbi:MAG: phospholipid carrier-dependent glycosyltransferase [Actinomycetia bacterium]|nr:phospholipid carrier-dependent glycosyltransferase [Actinomycetes bacterium]
MSRAGTGPGDAAADLTYADLWTRLLGTRIPRSVLDWWGPIGFALIGGFLRLFRLGQPSTLVFDESYYVKQAHSMTQYGVELRIHPDKADEVNRLFEAGDYDIYTLNGDLVVHPPLGKWLIALGQTLFGVDNAFSWRIIGAFFGIAAILILGRAVRRLTGSGFWGTVAAGLLAFEGSHFTHSRTGVLDIFMATFVLAAFACLLVDRDKSREQLAWLTARRGEARLTGMGPDLGWRPWRLAAGALLGCAVATKWSALVFLAVFGLLTVFWDWNARRVAGYSRWFDGTLVRDAPFAFVSMVGTSLVIYALSWIGWFRSEWGYARHWAEANPATGIARIIPDPLRSLAQFHHEMITLTSGLSTEHAYASKPWTWMLQIRPTLFYKVETVAGTGDCPEGVTSCIRTVNSIGSPTIWWTGVLALVVVLVLWVAHRPWANAPRAFSLDWRLGAALSGITAGYLPWFFTGDRTIYSFYIVSFVPWVIMGIVLSLIYLADLGGTERARQVAQGIGIALVVLSVVWFIYYYPVYAAQQITHSQWQMRGLLPGWL